VRVVHKLSDLGVEPEINIDVYSESAKNITVSKTKSTDISAFPVLEPVQWLLVKNTKRLLTTSKTYNIPGPAVWRGSAPVIEHHDPTRSIEERGRMAM